MPCLTKTLAADERSQFLWKSACINLWTAQLSTLSRVYPSLLQSAFPMRANPRAAGAYVESILHSSSSSNWRRLYFLSTKGIVIDDATGSLPAAISPRAGSSATSSPNSSASLQIFSPLQLLLKGDLNAWTLAPSQTEQEDNPKNQEYFLDLGATQQHELMAAGSGIKALWSIPILPGFVWSILALPPKAPSSAQTRHFIAHTATITHVRNRQFIYFFNANS